MFSKLDSKPIEKLSFLQLFVVLRNKIDLLGGAHSCLKNVFADVLPKLKFQTLGFNSFVVQKCIFQFRILEIEQKKFHGRVPGNIHTLILNPEKCEK